MGTDSEGERPCFPGAVVRTALLENMERAQGRALLLVAPSGWGKTVAAAQWADRFGGPVAWVSCPGVLDPAISPDDIFNEYSALSAGGSGSLLVLDGLDRIGPEVLRLLESLVARFESAALKLLVTARVLDPVTRLMLPGGPVLTEDALGMSATEVAEMLISLGVPSDGKLLADLARRSGGHPGSAVLLAKCLCSAGGLVEPRSPERLLCETVARMSDPSDEAVLAAATMIAAGNVRDLPFPLARARASLERIERALPLVRVSSRDCDGQPRTFEVDPALAVRAMTMGRGRPDTRDDAAFAAVCSGLADRGGFERACELLRGRADGALALDWLRRYGDAAVGCDPGSVDRLFDSIEPHLLTAEPEALLVWASALRELGMWGPAVRRATAAEGLAAFAGDEETIARAAALRFSCAARLGGVSGAVPPVIGDDLVGRSTALCDVIGGLVWSGRIDEATSLYVSACSIASPDADDPLQVLGVCMDILNGSDSESAAHRLSRILSGGSLTSMLPVARTTAAFALCEAGRLESAKAMLEACDRRGHRSPLHHLIRSMIEAGSNNWEAAEAALDRGMTAGLSAGDDGLIALLRSNRVIVSRAHQRLDESLEAAERACAYLEGNDVLGLRPAVLMEMAMTRLCMGDLSHASRILAMEVVREVRSPRERLRLALVRTSFGLASGAVEQEALSRVSEYLGTDSANWTVAMHVRAMPTLFNGVVAALGASGVSTHLLKMVSGIDPGCDSGEPAGQCLDRLQAIPASVSPVAVTESDSRPLHLNLFGGFDLRVSGHTVADSEWRKRKARTLVAMLAVVRGRRVARERVLDHLWPDMDANRAMNNLHVTMNALRKMLSRFSDRDDVVRCVKATAAGVLLPSSYFTSDLDDFDRALRTAREAEVVGEADRAIHAYREIGRLYAGDVLACDPYDDWFVEVREHYRLEFADAMLRLADLLIGQGKAGEAFAHIRRTLRRDEIREDLVCAAIRCAIATGQRSAAVSLFMDCRRRLDEELGLDPAAETMTLYQQVLSMESPSGYGEAAVP